jgi:hypothetical protein
MAQHDKPTPRQQRYLRALAQSTGTSFTPPQTRREASQEIDRLKGLGSSSNHERHADRQAVQQAQRGGGTRVRDGEITGYGSKCRWKGSALETGEDS